MLRFLEQNLVSSKQIRQNPQAVILILNGLKKQYEISENALLTNAQFNKQVARVYFKCQNPKQAYQFIKQLRKGPFCTVFQVLRCHNPNECWAVRIMHVQNEEILKNIKIQIVVMLVCSNPFITNYFTSYYFMNDLYMLTEFMDGGSLADFIVSYIGNIPQNVSAFIMRQIWRGIDVIHLHKQIHRDLKGDNILIDKMGRIKIADFGYAIQLTREQKYGKQTVGAVAWMAPQLICKQNYNELVDIWSVGMIAVELAEGQLHYLREPHVKPMVPIVSNAAHRLNPIRFSYNYCDFVSRCLEKNIQKRWTAQQLLKHPFITQIESGERQRQIFMVMVRNIKKTFIKRIRWFTTGLYCLALVILLCEKQIFKIASQHLHLVIEKSLIYENIIKMFETS